MDAYVVVEEVDEFIQCLLVTYSFQEAVAKVFLHYSEDIRDSEVDKAVATDLYSLEADNGFGFTYEVNDNLTGHKRHTNLYILEYEKGK